MRGQFLKKFILVLGIGGSLLYLSACSFLSSESDLPEGDNSTNRISFSYSEWPPDTVVFLAKEKGFFEKHGVNANLEWVVDFEETFEKADSGEVNVWAATLFDAVQAPAEDDWSVILVEDYSAGADAIVTLDNSIDGVADLSGKKIGVESGTVGEFFLQILLEREGLTLDDIEEVEMNADSVPAALQSGEIDAGVTYEPNITEIITGGGNVVVDSAKERGAIVDVYIAKKSHIEKNEELYINALKAIMDAQEFLNENPEEAAEILMEPLGLSKEEVIEAFEKLSIPDFQDNQTAFNRSAGFQSLHNLARQAEEYLRDQGIIEGQVDIEGLINSDLIELIDR